MMARLAQVKCLRDEVVSLLEILESSEGGDGCLAVTRRGTQCRNPRAGNVCLCTAHQKHPPAKLMLPFSVGDTLSELIRAVRALDIREIQRLKHELIISDKDYRRSEKDSSEGLSSWAVGYASYACNALTIVQQQYKDDPEMNERQEQVAFFAPCVSENCRESYDYLRLAHEMLVSELGL